MDDLPREAIRLPDPTLVHPVLPEGFVPLRMQLRPGDTVVELNRPDIVAGRHSDVDFRLPLPDVSRRHCRFHFEAGQWHIYDLKSLNGIRVNDQAVTHAILKHGDVLKIGGFVFVIDLDGTTRSQQAGAITGSVLMSIYQALPNPDRKAS